MQWAQKFGGATQNIVNGIAADAAGDVVLASYFSTSADVGGGNLPSAGGFDTLVAKMSGSGGYAWAKPFGSSGNDYADAVTLDSAGNVIVTGLIGGPVDFGGGPLGVPGENHAFVTKLDATGAHVWSRSYGDGFDAAGTALGVDASGNIYVGGGFSNTIDFGNGVLTCPPEPGGSLFVAKLPP